MVIRAVATPPDKIRLTAIRIRALLRETGGAPLLFCGPHHTAKNAPSAERPKGLQRITPQMPLRGISRSPKGNGGDRRRGADYLVKGLSLRPPPWPPLSDHIGPGVATGISNNAG